MENELEYDEPIEWGVNIKLRENTVRQDGTFFASVSARTGKVKEVMTAIKEDGDLNEKTLSLMRHHLKLYQEKLLELLRRGYAVKVLDLGVLRIRLKGAVESLAEAESLRDFSVAFTPTAKTREAVKDLSIDGITLAEKKAAIEAVADISRGAADGRITAGEAVRVSGKLLKLGQESDGIWFVPQTASLKDVEDASLWIAVERDKVFRNVPSTLEFFAPSSLEAGVSYRIRVESSYLSANVSRKAALVAESEAITALKP